MIRVSLKKRDAVFVSRELRTNKLSPVPLDGYYDRPDYRWAVDGWGRVIERYPWGAVLYIESPNAKATVIAVGEFDPATGLVNGESIPLRWYAALARRIEEMNTKTTTIPDCSGYWVAGVTCDGGVNAAGESEDACSWRRKCRLVQEHMIQIDSDPSTYKARYGPDSLGRLVERLEKGNPKPKKKAKKRPRKKAKKKSTKEQRRVKRYAPYVELARRFGDIFGIELRKNGSRSITWVERRTAAVKPGCVYFVERTQFGAFFNLYLRRAKGRAFKLAVIRLVPINGGLDFQIASEDAPPKMPEECRSIAWNDPPMFSVLRTLSTDDHLRWIARYLIDVAVKAMS